MFKDKIFFRLLFILAICQLHGADELGRKTYKVVKRLLMVFDHLIFWFKLPKVDHSCMEKLGRDPTVDKIKNCTDTPDIAEKYLTIFKRKELSINRYYYTDIVDAIEVIHNKVKNVPYFKENQLPLGDMMDEFMEFYNTTYEDDLLMSRMEDEEM